MNFYPFNHPNILLRRDNKAVLRNARIPHLNGYVAFKKSDIPQEWWGTEQETRADEAEGKCEILEAQIASLEYELSNTQIEVNQ